MMYLTLTDTIPILGLLQRNLGPRSFNPWINRQLCKNLLCQLIKTVDSISSLEKQTKVSLWLFFMILRVSQCDFSLPCTACILKITRGVCFSDLEQRLSIFPCYVLDMNKNKIYQYKLKYKHFNILSIVDLYISITPLVLSDFLTSNMNIWDKYNPGIQNEFTENRKIVVHLSRQGGGIGGDLVRQR